MKSIVIFDIDGVIRDVTGSYRRALADTVEYYTNYNYRPSMDDIDNLKAEGIWNNDWEGSQELILRYFESIGKSRDDVSYSYSDIVNFFQSRYRGSQPDKPETWEGYITTEPLLVTQAYFTTLTANKYSWGFFSGATRGSAEYILKHRLALENPVLIAMEDALGKPDPTGLFLAVQLIEEKLSLPSLLPVVYLGDTVADMTTIINARKFQPEREFIAVGVLPPHIQGDENINQYSQQLLKAGANKVVLKVTDFI
ncbi:MAG: TIGR01548 family HAD-type hydrolase [Cyanobacteria bacterium]|nr:TIGR01548 family HAD-type hydrolase [Cyanobacteria bacterium CG_2015-16_32_12]NCO78676.1 TIGR01548 family HAD-type hydrolase [Cyanobacteria bacterium CG_2015-22_32_23]NCQ05449.1 TIGR01548 family HAD-type hydrolase [Cyanobacteria bacterium CG_2015-09_32_10]NCQ41431.1 TIGR01548 family HAD-type hydrolase [Cyanobacteria bacterium CG_2015-04_32_10]NCS85735.1 TIGR01548 family HAD-type hydrolase [Cyanobacteria bacterium CG_2015-02_32_10]